ncbi:MAG: MOSC domain-containing protein [Thalassolituus sp.]|uniref:MOSC domain-containing protein n=1 Tax=Thalassolituus sp. TaxID=2030822 RepID=UPI00398296B6
MKKVGVIKEIWRYPVKGMAGELLQECSVGAQGLTGDRVWALRDTARQEIQSCKFRPELLTCTAKVKNDPKTQHIQVTFADGSTLNSDSPDIHQRLSELVGHDSTLESLRPLSEVDFYRRHKLDDHTWLDELKATFSREPGEPLPDFSSFPQQAQDFVTVPGTFFLVTPFHIITTATMEHFNKLLPEADWDIRRFRPNIVIDTTGYDDGLVEQYWIGKQISIANSLIDCTATAPRCGAVTRMQNGLDFDKSMLRTIVKEADQNLGIYGSIKQEGTLRVGDAVYISDN